MLHIGVGIQAVYILESIKKISAVSWDYLQAVWDARASESIASTDLADHAGSDKQVAHVQMVAGSLAVCFSILADPCSSAWSSYGADADASWCYSSMTIIWICHTQVLAYLLGLPWNRRSG